MPATSSAKCAAHATLPCWPTSCAGRGAPSSKKGDLPKWSDVSKGFKCDVIKTGTKTAYRQQPVEKDQVVRRCCEGFEDTWASPWVATRFNQAKRINRAYGIASVPTIVVNGKFVTDEGMAGSKPELVAVIDELVASER